jgi:hypothetical protein
MVFFYNIEMVLDSMRFLSFTLNIIYLLKKYYLKPSVAIIGGYLLNYCHNFVYLMIIVFIYYYWSCYVSKDFIFSYLYCDYFFYVHFQYHIFYCRWSTY